jgi:hypothetical protein
MVQMIGVLVLAMGLPRLFASIEHGGHLDNSVMVVGYVIMRIAMVFQWLRAGRQDPARYRACLTYAITISIAQLGWVALIFLDFLLGVTLILSCAPSCSSNWRVPSLPSTGTAARPGMPITSSSATDCSQSLRSARALWARLRRYRPWSRSRAGPSMRHWSASSAWLTFGKWWVYYILPAAQVLHAHRNRVFGWGYG